MPGGPEGDPQSGDSQPGDSQPGEEGWVDADSGDSDWETSNQAPGTADIPPMPSEQGNPPGTPRDGTPGSSGADGELDEALEDFDGEILAEREVIRARSNEGAGAAGSSIPMPSPSGGSEGESAEGVPGAEQGSNTPGAPMGVPRSRSAPPAPVAGGGQIPDDIPDATDDDIIARQLREAAMQETDPELKEALWDEYRRYKGA